MYCLRQDPAQRSAEVTDGASIAQAAQQRMALRPTIWTCISRRGLVPPRADLHTAARPRMRLPEHRGPPQRRILRMNLGDLPLPLLSGNQNVLHWRFRNVLILAGVCVVEDRERCGRRRPEPMCPNHSPERSLYKAVGCCLSQGPDAANGACEI